VREAPAAAGCQIVCNRGCCGWSCGHSRAPFLIYEMTYNPELPIGINERVWIFLFSLALIDICHRCE
jgi:hypothetical protein